MLEDLRGQVSSLQGLASDLEQEKGKVSQWWSLRGTWVCLGSLGREGADEEPPVWDDTGAMP